MSREELKEIIIRVVTSIQDDKGTPVAGCVYNDRPWDECDVTSFYSISEED